MEITKEDLAKLFESVVKDKIANMAKVQQADGAISVIQMLQKRLEEPAPKEGTE